MIFHLAIPSRDLEESSKFYEMLGATIGRKYPTHIVMNYYGQQVVPHLTGEWERDPKMYPRHFGVILGSRIELKALWDRWQFADFVFEEYFVRHKGRLDEHHTFFLKDPSNNLIEFKWYRHFASVF